MANTSQESSGCLGKSLLGCGVIVVLLLLACGGAAYFVFPKLEKFFEQGFNAMQNQALQQELLANWTPPSDELISGDELFPPQFDAYHRSGDPDQAALDQFGLPEEMSHAVYTSADGESLNLYVTLASQREASLKFSKIKDKVDEHEQGAKFSMVTPKGILFSVSPPTTVGQGAASQGWFFLATGSGDSDLGTFLLAYLTAIEGEPVDNQPGKVIDGRNDDGVLPAPEQPAEQPNEGVDNSNDNFASPTEPTTGEDGNNGSTSDDSTPIEDTNEPTPDPQDSDQNSESQNSEGLEPPDAQLPSAQIPETSPPSVAISYVSIPATGTAHPAPANTHTTRELAGS